MSLRVKTRSKTNLIDILGTLTEIGLFALVGRDFEQILGQIVSLRVRHLAIQIWWPQGKLKGKKSSLPVDVRRSKALLLKLPITREKRSLPVGVYHSKTLLLKHHIDSVSYV